MNPNRMRRIRPALALVATAGLAAAGGAGIYAATTTEEPDTVVRQVTVADSSPAAATTSGLSVSEIYERTHRGVVEITVTGAGSQGQGSGFVYDREGHVVTNQHVVESGGSISVRFWNGETYDATVVGSDASTDLAVIDVDAPASVLHPIALGDSSKLDVGDGVVALGSPFGLEGTITSGIVSALHRQMRAPNNFTINDSIQTDAAINHGNSGGPLLDMQGKVVGVNAQIESESGGNDGVGFAIPSNTVRSIVTQLLGSGTVQHAYLGVSVETIPESVAGELNSAAGVALAQVNEGSPAARAGLRPATGTRAVSGQSYPTGGDVITAVDGEQVSSAQELQVAIDSKRPGETVTIAYVRDGERRNVDVELGTRPS
jgi:S1-C subfamily serine protease